MRLKYFICSFLLMSLWTFHMYKLACLKKSEIKEETREINMAKTAMATSWFLKERKQKKKKKKNYAAEKQFKRSNKF